MARNVKFPIEIISEAARKKMRARCLVLMRALWPARLRAVMGANNNSLGEGTRPVDSKDIVLLQSMYRS